MDVHFCFVLFLFGFFWNTSQENFDFNYTEKDTLREETLNTARLNEQTISELKSKNLSIEINNIQIDNINTHFCELNIESILFNRCKINSIKNLKTFFEASAIPFMSKAMEEQYFDLFHKRIKEIMVEKNIKSKDVIESTGINQSVFSKIVNGDRKPSKVVKQKLSEYFNEDFSQY